MKLRTALLCAALMAACTDHDGALIGPGPQDDHNAALTADSGAPQPVRFVVLGDTGMGNLNQRLVAEAIRDKCAQDGCDFVVMLGDNIYDSGVSGISDPQWQTKFEIPYRDINLPFFVVLGNHDYGGRLIIEQGGLGNEFDKGPIEVMYSDVSTKWNMPATHYTFRWGNVGFIMLDTNSILWDDISHGDQWDWYPTALTEVAGADWIFAAGHHPYKSNGSHGNAGNYESVEVGGVLIPNPVPIMNGGFVKWFFDDLVCGTVDIYFAGHDHNRQWLDMPGALCGAELIVNGAGAKVKGFKNRGNRAFWQDDSTEGFLYVEVNGNTLRGQFIDKHGVMNYQRQIVR